MSKSQRGFSLVEMMIAMVVGLIVVAAIISVFLLGNRNYREDDRFARMQENGRYALKLIAGELANVGFWGGIPNPVEVANGNLPAAAPNPPGDCGVVFDGTVAFSILSKTTAATAQATFSCINDYSTVKNGTDVFLIQRVNSSPAPVVLADTVYLRVQNLSDAKLYVNDNVGYTSTSAIPTLATSYWEYRPHIYYIGETAADPVPRLLRKAINKDAEMKTDEEMAEGIEQVRIFFGIDSDNDGVANQYKASPTAAELPNIVNARVYILVRSSDKDHGYQDTKTYQLGDTCYNVAGNNGCTALTDAAVPSEPAKYHRRVFSTTVLLRNPYYLKRLGA